MKLIDFIKDLIGRKFYGTVTINFQHGKIINVEQKVSRKDIVV